MPISQLVFSALNIALCSGLVLGCAKSSRLSSEVKDAGVDRFSCATDSGCEDASGRDATSALDARREVLDAVAFDATGLDADIDLDDAGERLNNKGTASSKCADMLREQDCVENPNCEPAYSSGGDGNTVVFLGCYSARARCEDAVVYAREPGRSNCVQLNSTCIPDEWEFLGTIPCSEYCVSLSGRLSRCEQTEGCTPLFGREAREDEPRFVGCVPTPQGCDDAITCARLRSDRCLEFPNSCLPDGAEVAACDAPGCPEEPAIGTVVDCDIETVMDFLAADQQLTDCGVLKRAPSETELASLHACVAEAQAQGLAYRAVWQMEGIDSIVRSGSFGVLQNGELSVYRFSSDSNGVMPNGAFSWWLPCESYGVSSECPAEVCIECVIVDDGAPCECRWNDMQVGPASLFCST